jgi:hypothetical protein
VAQAVEYLTNKYCSNHRTVKEKKKKIAHAKDNSLFHSLKAKSSEDKVDPLPLHCL